MNNITIKLNDASGDLSKSWFVYISMRDPDTGQYIRYRKYISRKLKTATARRQKAHEIKLLLQNKLQRGWDPISDEMPGKTKLVVALNTVVAFKKVSVRHRSFQAYEMASRWLIRYLTAAKMENMKVEDFTRAMAMRYMDYAKVNRRLSNGTYNKNVGYLRTLFNELIQRDYIEINPFAKIRKLPVEEPTIVAFSRSDLGKVSRYLPEFDLHLYMIAQLVFTCFIRPAEIVKLKASNIDLQRRLITIPASVSKTKKNNTLLMPESCARVMEELRVDLIPGNYFLVGHNLMPSKKHTHANRIHERWRLFAQKYDIPNSIYNLKHTGCGMAIEQGINVRDIQLQLRHHSLEMTQKYLDRFSHVASRELARLFPEI